jgi:hypothetical protein
MASTLAAAAFELLRELLPPKIQALEGCPLPAHLLTSTTGRQADEIDPDGPLFPVLAWNAQHSQYYRACGGWTERDIHIMGTVHYDHAPHNRTLHELHASAEEDTSCPRDCYIDLRRYSPLYDVGKHSDLTPFRYGSRPYHQGHTWAFNTRQRQLRLPILLQSTSSANHTGLRIRAASGTLRMGIEADIRALFWVDIAQANFFRNIGTILTFAFAGTFISAVVLGLILYLWTRIPLDGLSISFVEAFSVGATLSATDPVTILAIFNVYKVEPKLYTVIFGESILNDAIAIVLFETAQRYREGGAAGNLTILTLFEAIGIFLAVFFGSLLIGVVVGIGTALALKYTLVRRFPKIESCLIVLIAYASYFFSNGVHMSGELPNRAATLRP